ncbi:MAG: thiamine phosphate synthase [Rhodoferax sp.]|nr:thiamine phosphate synthase [Rhodoferax sp.]
MQGLDNLRYWAGLLPLPVVGIGGISMDNVAAVRATGAASAMVISAITQSPDPEAACRTLVREWGLLKLKSIILIDFCIYFAP